MNIRLNIHLNDIQPRGLDHFGKSNTNSKIETKTKAMS